MLSETAKTKKTPCVLGGPGLSHWFMSVSYTHLRAHETPEHLVCRLLLEKKKHMRKVFIEEYDKHREMENAEVQNLLYCIAKLQHPH